MSDHTPVLAPPSRLARRPRDRHGRIVPWFAGYADGEPDHRVVRPGGVAEAFRLRLCFLCGGQLGAYASFVIGPMCALNRVSAEPPSHRTCAEYAPAACPHLANPQMRRRPDLPESSVAPDGVMVLANPGTCLVWTTRSWEQMRGMQLFTIGDPVAVSWWTEGRRATYAEALDALMSGLDRLRTEASKDGTDFAAQEQLTEQYERALAYLPGNTE